MSKASPVDLLSTGRLPVPSAGCAVLFADLSGSTNLYRELGDEEAFSLVRKVLGAIGDGVGDAKGRVVKTTGDGLLATFWQVDAAAEAAVAIHAATQSLLSGVHGGVGLRMGMHYGPVLESDSDIFGDTVNVAARLMDCARPGVTVISQIAAGLLSDAWLPLLRPLRPLELKGLSRPLEVMQLVLETGALATQFMPVDSLLEDSAPEGLVELVIGERRLVLGQGMDRIAIGRGASADVVLSDPLISRLHAVLEVRGSRVVLTDRSANGTYITSRSEQEYCVHYAEATLRESGWLAFGCPRANAGTVIAFRCL